jgi:hypothetical protein
MAGAGGAGIAEIMRVKSPGAADPPGSALPPPISRVNSPGGAADGGGARGGGAGGGGAPGVGALAAGKNGGDPRSGELE